MFKKIIHNAGLRATPARIEILKVLSSASKPMSHAELSSSLAKQQFDRATIFRNLTALSEVGLLSRLDVGDHIWRFELKTKHPHFICTGCGEVACLSESDIELSTKMFLVSEVLLKGHCQACQKQ